MQSIVSSEQGANQTKYLWSDCRWNPVCKYDIPTDFKIVLKTAEQSRPTEIHITLYPFVRLKPTDFKKLATVDQNFILNYTLRSTV